MPLRLDTDPADMEPDERLDEVAGIFARSVLRLHGGNHADIAFPQNPEESSATCLELSASPRPDGSAPPPG